MSTIRIEGIPKSYRLGHAELPALRGVDLTVNPAEIVGIVGPAGSGKTTLLNILGCIDSPSSRRGFLDDVNLCAPSDREITGFRRSSIGFIVQTFNPIPVLSAAENVELPLIAPGYPRVERRRVAEESSNASGSRSISARGPTGTEVRCVSAAVVAAILGGAATLMLEQCGFLLRIHVESVASSRGEGLAPRLFPLRAAAVAAVASMVPPLASLLPISAMRRITVREALGAV